MSSDLAHPGGSSTSTVRGDISLKRVPVEILCLILGCLDGITLSRVRRVSQRWCSAIQRNRELSGILRFMGVYCFGGFNGNAELKSAEAFRVFSADHRWINIHDMPSPKSHIAVTVCNRVIYACGGRCEDARLNTCWKYSPLDEEWSVIASMSKSRSAGALAPHSPASKLFMFGGFDGEDELGTAEAYSIRDDTWVSIPSMPIPRSQMCGSPVINGDTVLLIGGCNNKGRDALKAVDAFNLRTGTYSTFPDLPNPRVAGNSVVIGEVVYVFGGCEGEGRRALDSVLMFDLRVGAWSPAPCKLNKRRVNLASVLLPGETVAVIGGFCPEHPFVLDETEYPVKSQRNLLPLPMRNAKLNMKRDALCGVWWD